MTTQEHVSTTSASAAYAALRHGGAPPAVAWAQLGVDCAWGLRLERSFRRRPGGGPDAMRPKFARHEAHVETVRRAGGYPVLPEKRR